MTKFELSMITCNEDMELALSHFFSLWGT